MITDRLSNVYLYESVHPRLAAGLKYLAETDFSLIPPGKYEIDGSNIFALIQEYDTLPIESGKWESHYRYTDIQYMISGSEIMGYAYKGKMQVVEEHKDRDLIFLEGEGSLISVPEGAFCIFTPEDAHMPSVTLGNTKTVKKVVIKVLIGSDV